MDRSKDPKNVAAHTRAKAGGEAATILRVQGAKELRSGLRRVQICFAAVLIACVAALFVCDPRLSDQQRLQGLRDLEALSGDVDIPALKNTLARKAERDLAFNLQQVTQAAAVPELTAVPSAGAQTQLLNATPPELANLDALARFARSGAQIPVYGPSVDALAAGLRWRMSRRREPEPLVLRELRLSREVDQATVDAEAGVEPARVAALEAVSAYEQALDVYNAKRELTEKVKGQGASKDALRPFREARSEAYEVLTENKTAMQRAKRTYERLVSRAQRRSTGLSEREKSGGRIVVATLDREGKKPWEIEIAMALPPRFAQAPALAAPASLRRLEENPLWPGLKGLSTSAATEDLKKQVSFHLRSTEFQGIQLSGATALHGVLLLLLVGMGLLILACRKVLRVYNPIGSNQGAGLPLLGTGSHQLDCALLIALPALVCGLTCWALVRIDVQPWIAFLLSASFLVLGLVAARMWRKMHRLLHSARQRSMVRPLPERSWPAVR